jgi:hypothetical protein
MPPGLTHGQLNNAVDTLVHRLVRRHARIELPIRSSRCAWDTSDESEQDLTGVKGVPGLKCQRCVRPFIGSRGENLAPNARPEEGASV